MTKEREALKLALEVLEFIPESGSMLGFYAEAKRHEAIIVIKEASAQPERPWVGLTAKEKHEIRYSHMTSAEFIEFIEAKLKEKNT